MLNITSFYKYNYREISKMIQSALKGSNKNTWQDTGLSIKSTEAKGGERVLGIHESFDGGQWWEGEGEGA